jgi:hypothetical protein
LRFIKSIPAEVGEALHPAVLHRVRVEQLQLKLVLVEALSLADRQRPGVNDYSFLANFVQISGNLGQFWGSFEQFWAILGNFGQFWAILGNFGQFWAILGQFWPILANYWRKNGRKNRKHTGKYQKDSYA